MRKYDSIDKLGLVVVFCAVLAFSFIPIVKVLRIVFPPTHKLPDFKLTDFSKAGEEEKEALSIFYDSDIISEGKCFDLKFIYFEPYTDKAIMEIVKKTDADLADIYIETWSENKEFISRTPYWLISETPLYGTSSGYTQQYLQFIYGNDFLNDYYIKIKYNDNILIKVKILYDEYTEEEIEVRFNLEKSYQELERRKKAPITSRYEGQQVNYYYGLLLLYDKDRWFQEVNDLIDSDKNEYLDYAEILETGVCWDPKKGNQDGCEKSLYQFNDEEYAKYQRMVQRAKDKELFNY